MRYTCLKTIVTKVFDGVLDDSDDVLNVLRMLNEKELTCSMQVKKGPVHDRVRILAIEDGRITWRLLKAGTSLQKKSDIADIMSIKVNVNDDLMIQLKPEPSRWSTLDASET
jgi:hypothetical protein